ncbi:MAG: caspase family protein [Fimbriimonadales bacterium]|nr:caspase family protein [Fimbriimonadales bacterium]
MLKPFVKWACLLLMFVALGHSICAQSASLSLPTGKRHAVIVGVNKFQHLPAHQHLNCAVADAQTIHALLVQYYGFAPENVTLLTDEQATRAAILRALGRLCDPHIVGKNDQVLIFFSTHSILASNREGFLIPYDGEVSDAGTSAVAPKVDTCIAIASLIEQLRRSPALQAVVLLDTSDIGSIPVASPTNSAPTLPSARQLLAACSQGQTAWEDTQQGLGAFTSALATVLRTYVQRGSPLTASELFVQLYRSLAARYQERQTPRLVFVPGYEGDFVFFPVPPASLQPANDATKP